jgi:hypothetical protein
MIDDTGQIFLSLTWKFLSDRRIVTIEKRSCEEKN